MESLIRIVNDEDRQAFEWLVANVGAQRVGAAAQRLAAGGKRPFVSALCRYLGAWPPAARRGRSVAPVHTAVGDLHLARIREMLAQSNTVKARAH
ncbi:hypothetical protein [Paraburkholderia unamae]|uniref:Uncharacterized protein n=1 Tax=Paraburkholderia unamae TaxID=219649 RepID=A0ABX5K7E1_9BURK|nr:hypothetical protein [Paraburkholderia unamae]PVX62737.1 hypothetical protein C7402_13944 [Paraburkholderia unamae]